MFLSLCTRIIAESPEFYKNASKGDVLFHWRYRFVRPDRTWKMKKMKLVKSGKRGTEQYSYQGDTGAPMFHYRLLQATYRGKPGEAQKIVPGTVLQAMSGSYPRKIRFLKVSKVMGKQYVLDLLHTIDSKKTEVLHGYGERRYTTLVPGGLQKRDVVTASLGKVVYGKETLQLPKGSLGDEKWSAVYIYTPAKPVLKQTHEGARLLPQASNLDTI